MIYTLFDKIIAALVLTVFLPIIALIALGIMLCMGRPVLYRDKRLGYQKHPITLFKFRTMRPRTSSQDKDSARLTPLGRLLRSTSLDELPQLWNVLKGELSMVGPRPLLPEYCTLYTDEQDKRHCVMPGLTGWAQVNGRNALTWEEKFTLDLWFVENQSIHLYFWILFKTVAKVLKREGISHEGHVSMEKFKGCQHE